MGHPAASKAEAQKNLAAARERAGKAWQAKQDAADGNPVERDATSLHYDHMVREFEECIYELGVWDDGETTD